MFRGKATTDTMEVFGLRTGSFAEMPPGVRPMRVTRAASMIVGGLLAVVGFLLLRWAMAQVTENELQVGAVACMVSAVLAVGGATFLFVYGVTADILRARDLGWKVMFWTAIAVGILALLALGGAFGGGDRDSDHDSGGGDGGDGFSGSDGSGWLPSTDWNGNVQGGTSSDGVWTQHGSEPRTATYPGDGNPRASLCPGCGMRVGGFSGGLCLSCSQPKPW
jgi:hypothetical protein